MRDPYAVLGVSKSASDSDIKKAFRTLAKKYHPDANRDDPKAQERFAEISHANEIVGDPDKRKKFDRGEIDANGKEAFGGNYPGGNPFSGFDGFDPRRGRSGAGGGMGGGAGMSPEDIINTMFGGGLGGGMGGGGGGGGFDQMFGNRPGRTTKKAAPPKGKDIERILPVTIEQTIKGGKAKLSLPDGRTIAVSLPAFIEDGQIIRLKGQGEAGPAGHRGDVLAKISITPQEAMRIDGRKLIVDLDVPLAVAVKGGKAALQTPDGKIAVKIAPWTDSGHAMRIKGRGLPLKSGDRADLVAIIRIRLDEVDRSGLDTLFGDTA